MLKLPSQPFQRFSVSAFQRFTTVWRWTRSRLLPATKFDLEELEKKIMATQAEIAQDIRALTAQITKIGTETGRTLQKVTELEALITAGGDATPEVLEAVAAAKAAAQTADDLVPDAQTPETPPAA